jgi:hypothetical protein
VPARENAIDLIVHVRPGSQLDRVGGEHAGVLLVRVRARPVEGQANRAVRDLLARELGVAVQDVELLQGGRGRRKRLRVSGEVARLLRRVEELRRSV